MRTGIQPTDGMVITEDTRFAPGVYFLPNGLTIGADNITLEGENTLIVSNLHENVAIRAEGRRGITVRNLAISGYHNGLRFDDCVDVTVERVKVRDTSEIEGIDTFLYLWTPIEEVYGGAVLMHRCQNSTIRECDLQHQMNGVMLYSCTRITVENNNASFNSGWGIYLSSTNDSVIAHNQLDFCNRVYRRPESGAIRVEADAAAIVMIKGSSRNKVQGNSCLCGGDGIFVVGYDYEGTIEPCMDNLFEDNDCRLSPNNGVEYSFCGGGVFRRNDCSRSNYGFWMGYIWDTLVEDNEVEFSRWAGIASERGHNVTLKNNRVRLNGEGIRLWAHGAIHKDYPDFPVAYDYTVEDNLIELNRIGLNAYTAQDVPDHLVHDLTLKGNTIRANRVGAQFERVQDISVHDNAFEQNVVAALRLVNKPGVNLGANQFADNQAQEESATTRLT